jgi:hypothetical protein
MAILLIGDKEKAQIEGAIARARRHPLPLEIGRQMALPDKPVVKLADRRPDAPVRRFPPEQVLIPIGYRAAVSFEEQAAGLCMHLSISVERIDPKWAPSEPAVNTIAEAFGIQLADADMVWIEEYEPGRHAVNIVKVTEPRPEGRA